MRSDTCSDKMLKVDLIFSYHAFCPVLSKSRELFSEFFFWTLWINRFWKVDNTSPDLPIEVWKTSHISKLFPNSFTQTWSRRYNTSGFDFVKWCNLLCSNSQYGDLDHFETQSSYHGLTWHHFDWGWPLIYVFCVQTLTHRKGWKDYYNFHRSWFSHSLNFKTICQTFLYRKFNWELSTCGRLFNRKKWFRSFVQNYDLSKLWTRAIIFDNSGPSNFQFPSSVGLISSNKILLSSLLFVGDQEKEIIHSSFIRKVDTWE